MISWRVPAFRDGPLVEWGSAPRVEAHMPRARTFDVQHQVVRVRFDWTRRAVSGSTTLRIAPLADSAPVSVVVLDAVGMTIQRLRSSAGAALEHEYDGRTLTVRLAAPLQGRATSTFTIDYETVRPAAGIRFGDRRRTVWTHTLPRSTRHWVPTFDHPSDRTTWELFVRTTGRDQALSNGRLVASRRVGADTEWHWRLDVPAPTHLISVVTGDYTVLQDRWRSIPVGYWTYPDSVAAAWRGFGKTPRMMEWLTVRTGMPYPWSKYDQVVVSDLVGAVESATVSTMSDDAVLHPSWAEPHAHAATEGLVMHALARQWFGNLVAVRDGQHAWLSDGFAQMLEAAWREEDHGRDEAEYARALVRDAAVAADQRGRLPLVRDRLVDDQGELVTGNGRPRGAAVLEMLCAELGDSVFWSGVRRFLGPGRLATGETADLRSALESASGRDLSGFFDAWVSGAGFPAFQVAFAYDSASRQLKLEARQVQPRDALTPWFPVEVGVEVLTDAGAVRGTLESRDSLAALALSLPAPPRAILWDRGARLLHVVDFPRSTVMLAHQLRHAHDIPARLEAIRLLGERREESKAILALSRTVRADPFWALRARAAEALAGTLTRDAGGARSVGELRAAAGSVVELRAAADSVTAALLAATDDEDPRVREAATLALGDVMARWTTSTASVAAGDDGPRATAAREARGVATRNRLDSLALRDDSRFVRLAAVRSLVPLDPSRAASLARTILSSGVWLPGERRAALVVALGALLRHETASVRMDAARALGILGGASALAALEAQAAREADASARAAIDAAITRLREGSARD